MALLRLSPIAAVSTAFAATAATAYALMVYNRTSSIDTRRITAVHSVPDSFRASGTLRKVVNPRDHVMSTDTRTMVIDIPATRRHVSDQELLARFTKAFYNGWVFAPEKYLIRLLSRRTLVSFPAIASIPVPEQEWDTAALPEQQLYPMHSKILGLWQVVDVSLKDGDAAEPRESYVDMAFGNGEWPFAGSNRFSVERLGSKDDSGPLQVRLTYACVTCNPVVNKPSIGKIGQAFHDVYAMFLYKEAVAGLERWLDEPPQKSLAH
jgi:hypothetical protein